MADDKRKLSTGPNDRPLDSTVAQTGSGIPDDSSLPPEISDEEVERVRQKLEGDPRERLLKEVEEEQKASQRGSE
ncbi:hypothetical protein [Devosia sp. RR2S18]|uniref:hypothetical protein n=1 Tax=Devosia rhizosphaerae TaxID=3049774 RepID=UPI0025408AD8|nr:hypothetical protein [Devosia sp. RR2S18]WIJ25699.1 hypothetical protein QOV41_02730 [Devosia sp. RR2S18]